MITNTGFLCAIGLAVAFAVSSPVLVQAQSLEDDVRAMRLEIQKLQAEVESLRREVRENAAGTEPAEVSPAGPAEPEPSPASIVPLLRAQVREHAQTKVESMSKFPMKLFGTIVANTAWNSGEANWLELPNITTPNVPGQPFGSFTSTMRQTRLGAALQGPEIGGLKASGLVAIDFFGGISNFATGQTMGIPRLLYAYMRFDAPRTMIEIGQDHMILAPRNPTSLAADSFPLLFRSGNLYLRLPQIRAERLLASGRGGEVHLGGSIVAPVAGDFVAAALQFVPPALAGERSRMPGYQSRISWRATPAGPYEKPSWEIGGSGHFSKERTTAGSTSSWAAAFDVDFTHGRFGTGGEFFTGQNMDAFGGSAGQLARSHGGFIEGRLAATRQMSFNAGYGADQLFDVVRFPAALSRNASSFANLIYQVTPEIRGSLEYRRLKTGAAATGASINNHLNLTFAYDF